MPTDVTVPEMGESINEAVILRWIKSDGDQVAADEPICELETDKATFDLPAPAAGTLKTGKEVGATVQVGETIAQIGEAAAKPAKVAAPAPKTSKVEAKAATATKKLEPLKPVEKKTAAVAEKPVAKEQPPRKTEEDNGHAPAAVEEKPAEPVPSAAKPASVTAAPAATERRMQDKPAASFDANGSRRVPMSKIRRRIAERLVRAQHTAAMLTTFNEIDMTAVMELRELHKEQFEQQHGVSLGLMSFFSRATVLALKQFPAVNAEIDGDDIVYHDHVNLGVAVSTERGLVVPVLHGVENMSFAQIESEIKRVATAARDGKLSLSELSGGTFTITNGGVFGSLLSTPILNPPQCGILGMHTIQKRAVVINDRIKARRMMYVALSYDHRLVDGREAVSFLVKLKKLIEEPAMMLLEG
jgi:2-oxoglutarate dehydrogenase E2 component (dihydrolipoamide succinyltransferase)